MINKREKLFDELHDELATTLLAKIKSGEANASDLNVTRQFLRDNGIAGIPADNSPLKNLMDELPFTEDEVVKKFNGNSG